MLHNFVSAWDCGRLQNPRSTEISFGLLLEINNPVMGFNKVIFTDFYFPSSGRLFAINFRIACEVGFKLGSSVMSW